MHHPSPLWTLELDHVENWTYMPNVFTPEECQSMIDYGKSVGLESAAVGRGELNETVRNSNVVFLNPDEFTTLYYQKLTEVVNELNARFFGFDLFSFGEALQFTEYTSPGGKYSSHIDRIVHGNIRKLSIVVQLSDPSDYEGGDFQTFFSDLPDNLPKDRGTVLVFPSYVVHAVTPVTRGTRHSLVGWINGKPFR
jgi:PKHD-type hydroxylase